MNLRQKLQMSFSAAAKIRHQQTRVNKPGNELLYINKLIRIK